jgi:hypothetical protein
MRENEKTNSIALMAIASTKTAFGSVNTEQICTVAPTERTTNAHTSILNGQRRMNHVYPADTGIVIRRKTANVPNETKGFSVQKLAMAPWESESGKNGVRMRANIRNSELNNIINSHPNNGVSSEVSDLCSI